MNTSAKFNNASWVDSQLVSYGARTSGSLKQRVERLHRFMQATPKTPTKPASPIKTPDAPLRKMIAKARREENQADPKSSATVIVPTVLFDEDYAELRVLAEAAGMLEEEEEEEDSDYEPSVEEEDDDISLAHTDDLYELDQYESAVGDTWQIYLNTNASHKKQRALIEMRELLDDLINIRSQL